VPYCFMTGSGDVENVTQVVGDVVADDDDAGGRPRTERQSRNAAVDQQSTVGWTPLVTDWLTGKARPVTSRGMYI